MIYRELGKTGVKISVLGFGAMRLPSLEVEGGKRLDEEKGIGIIHRTFKAGVNYIDTAPYYCEGESERMHKCLLPEQKSVE